mmetsp:Transcript_32952/g.53471  ORF Transcript_32952/g.53471 Transcript_32952/m.53471 type:complete len:231 (-) Transcript_32952:25-717(-)
MGSDVTTVAQQPLDEKEVEGARQEFDKLVKEYGWSADNIFSMTNRQPMYCGTKDDIIQKYDDFFQNHILGEANPRISMPTGIYNHYLNHLDESVSECFKQLSPPDICVYKDDFTLQKRSQDGVYEWLLVAYINCRSAVKTVGVTNKFFVRFMFQVAIFSRIDENAKARLEQLRQQVIVSQQQENHFETPGNESQLNSENGKKQPAVSTSAPKVHNPTDEPPSTEVEEGSD